MSGRKGIDRYTKEDNLPSDGSEKDHESSEDEGARPTRPGRGGHVKGGVQRLQTQLYCFCKRPYSETEFMICCDGCENWFHGRCVGVTESMASSIDTYFCPECQKRRDGEEEEIEPEVVAPPKEKERPAPEPKLHLRSPASAPATPLDLPKVSPSNLAQPHSVTPPAASSRHKRKGQAMRSISKLTTLLPPPALPAPEILAREAAKFKTETTSSISNSLLDFAKLVQNSANDKKPQSNIPQPTDAKRDLLGDLRARAVAHDGNLSDSPSSSANPEVGNSTVPTPDLSEDVHPAKRRAAKDAVPDPSEEQHHKQELNAELAAAAANARSDDQVKGKGKRGGRLSPKNPRRPPEDEQPPTPEIKPRSAAPSSSDLHNGSAAAPAAVSVPPVAAAAAPVIPPPSVAPPAPSPATQAINPPAAAQPASLPTVASPEVERKGNRWGKRKNLKKEEESKPAPPTDVKAEPESQSEASLSQPAEVEPKRSKPRAKNAAIHKDLPVPEPLPTADDVIAPRRAKLAVYFPQDYNQRGKPSPQGNADTKDDKSSDEEPKEKTSPKRPGRPPKRKVPQPIPEPPAPTEAEHLAPRRAKLAAYFPEDYKGNEKEGEGADVDNGKEKGDDPRSGQEDRSVYCICKRSYDNRSFMMCCTRCKDWFHGTCVGIAYQEAKRIKNFVCPRCTEKRDK